MGGLVELLPTMMTVLLSVGIFIMLYVAFYGNAIIVNNNLLKPGFNGLSSVDLAHNFASCLSENQPLDPDNMQNKINNCRELSGASYAQVLDTETGREFSSGFQNSKQGHSIYRPMKDGNEISQARIHVKP